MMCFEKIGRSYAAKMLERNRGKRLVIKKSGDEVRGPDISP
jgi:hypothetical protein